MCMEGGAVRGGTVAGATGEIGLRATRRERLTEIQGEVIRSIL